MKTLLLADDSVTIQRVIELTFADEDVRVVSVGDGRRALQWMEREVPDVVLVDVAVPEVDGYALTAAMRQSARLRRVPVLLLAGAFEPVDDGKARQAGADGVLVKPFEPDELVGRVRELVTAAAPADPDLAVTEATPRGRRVHDADTVNVVTPFPSGPRPAPVPAPPPPTPTAEPAERASWEAPPGADRRERDPTLPSRVALANAFSALLAAEQSIRPASDATARAALSDAMIEDAVRRALVRMTDGMVRRIVVETAERLIREEIEKIKSSSE